MGCLRLSLDDFCACTPEEFESICKAYHEQREADYKDNWERMRLLATYAVQPHIKHKLTAQKLLPFPWDKPKMQQGKDIRPLSAEESKARFERLARRINGDGADNASSGRCHESHPKQE